MQKVIFYAAFALCALLAVAYAAPINEDEEVRSASRNAFQNGLSFFGDGIKREVEERQKEALNEKPRVYSQYTANIETPGRGKPALVEQYRHHHYYAMPPSVLPPQYPKTANGKFNAKQSAEVYVPRGPYQVSTDRLRIP